jgi:hypothetical protein
MVRGVEGLRHPSRIRGLCNLEGLRDNVLGEVSGNRDLIYRWPRRNLGLSRRVTW